MKTKNTGMSLMEVMITLVIIAIVAGLGYPKYQKMVARSKQIEAKIILRAIYVGQDLYKTVQGKYAEEVSDLDVTITAGVYNNYSIALEDGGSSFTATVRGNIDDDPAEDIWRIDSYNNLRHVADDAIETESIDAD